MNTTESRISYPSALLGFVLGGIFTAAGVMASAGISGGSPGGIPLPGSARISPDALRAAVRAELDIQLEDSRFAAAIDRYVEAKPLFIHQTVVKALEKQRGGDANQPQRSDAELEKAAKENLPLLTDVKETPFIGNPKGDLAYAYFFDVSCGYCKQTDPFLKGVVAKNPRLRVHFVEFPVLGPGSQDAAKVGIAVGMLEPGKYEAYHAAAMAHRGQLDEEVVNGFLKTAGLDVAKVRAKAATPEVQKRLDKYIEIAGKVGARGTPYSILPGGKIMPGAPSTQQDLENFLNDAVKAAGLESQAGGGPKASR